MHIRTFMICLSLALLPLSTAFAQSTAFSYQGRLLESGMPASGMLDIQFSLFAAAQGGSAIAPDVFIADVLPDQGIFSVELDFGSAVLINTPLWLEIRLRPTGGGAFTLLRPRQPLNQAPRAVHTQAVGPNSVNSSAIIDNSVTSVKILDGAVRSGEIQNGTITHSDVNTAEIQRRINGICGPNFAITRVLVNGNVNCTPDEGILDFPFAGTFFANAENGATDIELLRPTANHLCMLSKVQLRDVDGGSENALCRVRISGSNWLLEAASDNDSDAFCEAICLSFNPVQ